jgi:hypothetical protein
MLPRRSFSSSVTIFFRIQSCFIHDSWSDPHVSHQGILDANAVEGTRPWMLFQKSLRFVIDCRVDNTDP